MEYALWMHEGQSVPDHAFAACMLMANLCDESVAGGSSDTGTFGYWASDLWRAEDFFVAIAAAIAASVRGEPWPPKSF